MNQSCKRLVLLTMGCRVNQFESEVMRRQCLEQGFTLAADGESADLVVVNTCTVTGESDRQARQMIRRAARENPMARIVVTGCYAQRDAAALAAIPGVSLVLGNEEKLRLQRFLEEKPLSEVGVQVRVGDPDLAWEEGGPPLLTGFSERVRAHIQVQNGCDERCAFCVIPQMRGASRSVPLTEVLEQAKTFIAAGYAELVLSGINLGAYGRDLTPALCLASLLESLLNLPGLGRVRLSSLDPADLDPALVGCFHHPALAPHLHLSVQSGDDRILKRMHRRGNRATILDGVARLREVQPQVVLGADLIAGFPTESPEAFANTLALVQEAGLSLLHVFRYSSRPGTPAAAIPSRFHVPGEEIQRRAEVLRQAGRARLLEELERQRGGALEVVVESVTAGQAMGKSGSFLETSFPAGAETEPGARVEVVVEGVDGNRMCLLAREKKIKKMLDR